MDLLFLSKMKKIIITLSYHAPLLKRYCLKAGRKIDVGKRSPYGRVGNSGALYCCLPNRIDERKILVSRDYEAGSFYPPTLFIYGDLSFDELESFAEKFWDTQRDKVILPNGTVGNEMTWHNGLRYFPPKSHPGWKSVPERLKFVFPDCEVYDWGGYIEVDMQTITH